jgi:YidC/Oxa1 family membrane protein insertase
VPPAAPAPPVEEGPQKDAPEAKVERQAGHLTVGFTTRGGAVEYVELTGLHEAGQQKPLALVVPADLNHLLGQIDDTEVLPNGPVLAGARQDPPVGPLRRLNWTRDEAAEATSPENDVVYRFTRTDGSTLTKQWILPSATGGHDLRLRVQVQGASTAAPLPVKLLVTGGFLAEEPQGSMMGLPADTLWRKTSQREVTQGNPFGFEPQEVKTEGLEADPLALLGVRSQYFLVALFAAPGRPALPVKRVWATGEVGTARPEMEKALLAFYASRYGREAGPGKDPVLTRRLLHGRDQTLYAWAALDLPTAPAAGAVEMAFYVGPVSREELRADGNEPLASLITYPGAFDWLANLLLWIYDFWRGLFGSVGLAVILMTLTVRGGLMPLSIRNQLGMRRYGRKVAKIKPKVKQLQERFANNPKKLREEQMLLYREHGIGFPTGCLMMLLQIPIFFALFSCLRVEYTLHGATFGWIRDLSGPDRLVDLPAATPLISSINLLPILMVLLSIWHTKQMPKPTDEQTAQQMKMMKWMPILFAVILYNYTAALSLYMVMSSAIALIESRIVKRRDEVEVSPA